MSTNTRMRGRALQATRMRFWQADPVCKRCGRVIADLAEAELDHVVPISRGGADTDANRQLIHKRCHAEKTTEDMAHQSKGEAKRSRAPRLSAVTSIVGHRGVVRC